MRFAPLISYLLLFLTLCTASARQDGGTTSQSSPLIEEGKRDLEAYRFTDAEQVLKKAVNRDPGSATAHELLAQALLGQLPPNLHLFPDVANDLPRAETQAKKAVELSPTSASAWCTMGIVDRKLADVATEPTQMVERVKAAEDAFNRALAIDPKLFDAHYELGKMASDLAGMGLLAALTKSGVRRGQPGPIKNPDTLHTLQTGYSNMINYGLAQMQEALNIRPNSWLAMHQMGGLLQARALLRDTDEEYKADMDASREWSKRSVAATPKQPPPTAAAMTQAATIASIMSSIPAAERRSTNMIVMSPADAEKNLVKKVSPIYPTAAKAGGIEGDVSFRVTIDKEGHVKSAQLMSGNPGLAGSAREAINQWQYQPVVIDGQPQEFMTTVQVHFALPH